MKEKSAFDVVQENLRDFGWEPKTHANARHLVLAQTWVNSKFVFAEKDGVVFFASDSHGGTYSSTFTGIYTTVEGVREAECSVFRKEWFDRWLVSGKKKTGVTYIDRNFTIKSAGWLPTHLLTPKRTDDFRVISQLIKPIKLLIRNDYLDYLEPFEGKKLIGLETNRWIFHKEDVAVLLKDGKELISSMAGEGYLY